jgi:hypothetical protein
MTSQNANSAVEDSFDLKMALASDNSQDVEAKCDEANPDDTYQDQSAAKIIFLLTSVFMSMFLVALDRNIISTV